VASPKHLGKDAADGPHVNGGCVVECEQYQFRSPVPPCRYILSHLDVVVFRT